MALESKALSAEVSIVPDLRTFGMDGPAVRAARDVTLCVMGTVLGAKLDGALAYGTMQSICSAKGFDPLAAVLVHLDLLPATSAIMGVIALICQWPGGGPAAESGELGLHTRALRWGTYAFRAGLQFVAMMLVMSLAQPLFRTALSASPSSAVLGAVSAMAALALVSAALRSLARRIPFLVPFCCR